MRRLVALVALLLTAATAARASEESEALSSRGMLEAKQGNDAAAMKLFDQAVAADPQDAVALYHRGVALQKTGKTDAAIADFEAALRLRPGLNQAALELGITLTEAGRSDEGRPWLEQAEKQSDLAGQAAFFLGIGALREDDLEAARENFERARLADPSLEHTSRYYLGVVEYRMGHLAEAREHFMLVEQQEPQSAIGRESSAFLELIRAGEGSGTQVYGSLSLQYDSNVVLAPAQGVPASGQADGRVTINAGGVYEAWRNERMRLSVGYDFYQSLQFELHDFNLQDHRPTALLTIDFGPFKGGFLTQYDFYLLETSTFLQTVTAQPFVVLPEGDSARTELYVRFQWRDYLQTDFDILDGYNYAGGVRQVFTLGEPGREVWGGFQMDSEDASQPDGDLYAYTGVQFEVALLWPLPWNTSAQVGYRYRREDYDPASAGFQPDDNGARLDRESRAGVAFSKDINEMFSIVAAWVGTWNNSNKTLFEYDRQIGSLGVEVRY